MSLSRRRDGALRPIQADRRKSISGRRRPNIRYRVYGSAAGQHGDCPSLPLVHGQDFRVALGDEPDTTPPPFPTRRIRGKIVLGSCKGPVQPLESTNRMKSDMGSARNPLYGNTGRELIYRFQRVLKMEVSPQPRMTFIYGSQDLHRNATTARHLAANSVPIERPHAPEGQRERPRAITRDATAEEVYSRFYSISESPGPKGADLGTVRTTAVYVTRDDAKNMDERNAQRTEPGRAHSEYRAESAPRGTEYCASYRYMRGDFEPYIYRTDDFAKRGRVHRRERNGLAPTNPREYVRGRSRSAGLLL